MLARDDIERLAPALRRCAHALCAGPDAVAAGDELVRETLRRALQSRAPTEGVRLDVWLIAVLVDAARAAAARPGPGVAMPTAAPEQRSDNPAERAQAALAALAPADREALVLVGLARLGYAEAAAALGLSSTQLIARLSAARDQFAALTSGRRARSAAHLRVVK
ncbi:MAG: hypothetical protein JNK46_03390 [Methylobacteriaceae bacterium]|nr:hypothetical protein [Methylobacteriaceae bacterium]